MRTKVEKNSKKPAQQKLSFSLPSPKVVLNADDCARFLDSMGKTSVLLVEKDGKTVAATSKMPSAQPASSSASLTLPSLCSSSSASLTLPSPCSPPTLSSPPRGVIATSGAATQTKICRNWMGLTTAKSIKSTEYLSVEQAERPKAASANGGKSDHQGVSAQTPLILKPPKKRRGTEKKCEETTCKSPIFNNGDVHSAVSPGIELGDSDSMQRSEDLSVSLSSDIDTSKKHSVEHLLRHQAEPIVFATNCQTQNSECYSHDLRSHSSSQMNLSLMALATTSCILSPPSSSCSDPGKVLICTSQQFPHLCTSSSQLSMNHDYPGQTSPVGKSTVLSPPQHVLGSKVTTQSGNFQQLPEQVEPMNLSTSCNPDTEPPSLQAPSITESSATTEIVSSVSLTQHSIAQDSTEPVSLLSCTSSVSQQISGEKMPVSETADAVSSASGLQITYHSFHNGLSNCVGDRVSASSHPSASVDVSSRTVSGASRKVPHGVSDSAAGLDNQTVGWSSRELTNNNVTSTVEKHSQSQSTIFPSHSESVTPSSAVSSQESTTAGVLELIDSCKKSPTVIETETVLKAKRPPKKRAEIPMDEVSCADRSHRYSQTVDDVIANFVYIPEPVEEFSLTKEEAAIIDRSEHVHDCGSRNETELCTNNNKVVGVLFSASESHSSVQNGHDKPHVDAETTITVKPIKKRPTASACENQPTESSQDVQKMVENINSVIAFVAGNCSDLVSPTSSSCSEDINTKTQKKLTKKAATVVSPKKGSQQKKVKDGIQNKMSSTKELDSSAGENQEQKDVIVAGEGKLVEETEKVKKPKKIKKRDSDTQVTDKTDLMLTQTCETDGMSKEEHLNVVAKKLVRKPKTTKRKKINSEEMDLLVDSITNHSATTGDKETGVSNRAETSDIGESIASTSGGSEQDTPVHEPESKDDMTSTDPPTTDRENHDTGLESGGDDKPVRRYKKRLDFVKCDQCEHQARGRSALSRHMKKVHKIDVNMPFKCDHCGYGCTKMASLNRHLFTHGVFPCSRCSFVANERIRLTEHTVEQHKDKLDVKMCKICNRYIKCNIITIEQHAQECQGPTPFRCTECEKEFKYASSLRVSKTV